MLLLNKKYFVFGMEVWIVEIFCIDGKCLFGFLRIFLNIFFLCGFNVEWYSWYSVMVNGVGYYWNLGKL